jgi:pilus assembly protein Flp/PilA
MSTLTLFIRSEDGATAIEYGLIAGLIAVGLITAAMFFGDNLTGMFGFVRDRSSNALDNAGL